MKDNSDRNRWEIAENVSVAGSVIGSLFAVTMQNISYAAVPLSVTLGLSLINRRRFEQQFQLNMLAILSEVNSRITETDRKLSGEMQTLQDQVKSLLPPPQPVSIYPLEQELSELQKRFDSLEVAIERVSAVKPVEVERFDPTYLENQIGELKTAIIHTEQTTAQTVTKSELQKVHQQIVQLQNGVSFLNQAFNERPESSQIQALTQTTAAIQQQLSALPPPVPRFDPTPLQQQIEQLQTNLSLLTTKFKQRPEPQQINQFHQITASIQQQISLLPPPPPAFDPSGLEYQIDQLKTAIAAVEDAQTNFNAEVVKLPQLFEIVENLQQQQPELQQFITKLNQKIASLGQIPTQCSSPLPAVNFSPTVLKKSTVESVQAMANAKGIGSEMQLVIQAAKKHQLTLEAWPTNLIVGPASHRIANGQRNRSKCLFTMSGQPTEQGKIKFWLSSQAFADFYPVISYTVTEMLGFDGWREMEKLEVKEFVASLDKLFNSLY